jgi:UDP-N-acetylmuramoyl-L-alanyl-D-glutamate--2,6-diaminopimelate ligase
VRALTQDSRKARPDGVFVAVRGARVDGHDFVADVDAGVVVVERDVTPKPGVTCVRVADTLRALGPLAAALHGNPSASVPVVGVTGTNGKTTTTWMLEAICTRAGLKTGVVGTTGNRIGDQTLATEYTTPLAESWQALLAQMRDAGCDVVAAEVSSIGLAARRVDGTRFKVAVYTNLSQDHLDFHGSMEAYAAAKRRLFDELLDGVAIVHESLPAMPGETTWRYGLSSGDLRPVTLELTRSGARGELTTPHGDVAFELPLPGRFNVENALAAVGAALALGLTPQQAAEGLKHMPQVPGRLEAVPAGDFTVLVDYAHTPDALRSVLAELKPLARRLICVYGCGGDRDRSKRPLMRKAAEEGADVAIATSDNPRSEDPLAILNEMGAHRVVADRAEAIALAISSASEGDIVLIAGKGHETTQEILGVKHPFDDRLVAAEALA